MRKATLLVQVGTASQACGCVMVRKTAKMERMNSNVVNAQIVSCMKEPPAQKTEMMFFTKD